MKVKIDNTLKALRNEQVAGQLFGGYDFVCVLCGIDCFGDAPLCPRCGKSLRANSGNTCVKCGRAITGEGNYCSVCTKTQHIFDRAFSAVCFEGTAQRICHELKFGNGRWLAAYMARQIAKTFVASNITIDCATYVPMSAKEEKHRQYNQSRLLCAHFCDILDLPLTHLLTKCKITSKQEQCTLQQRLENLKGAFALNQGACVKDKTIALVDDVFTTGATADNCAETLLKHGAAKVYVFTYASRKEIILTE